MELYASYTANEAMETAMLLILSFLLVSCTIQRKRFTINRPLILLTIANMLLLLCQVVEWQIERQALLGDVPHVMLWRQVTYTLDYILFYVVTVCFFHYIASYICELCAERQIEKPYPTAHLRFLIGWGVVISILYAGLMSSQRIYFLDAQGNERYHIGLYFLMFFLSTAGMLSSCLMLVRNFRLLKGGGFWVLLVYVVLPFLAVSRDLSNSQCISYLMMSFFVFIIYIEINLRHGALILEQEAQLTELRTRIMLSQIQPHFLYNTLGTISTLCYLEGAPQAKEVVDRFSDYFRGNMDTLGKENFIPFEKELEHIRTYLWIEKVRFEEELHVEYHIEAKEFWLPSLSLQPLVENAVKHGICGKKGGGTVTIETQENESEYTVIIRDDGAGFDPSHEPDDGRTHVGIENITERLRILHAGSLEIESRIGQGTIATVHLPKRREKQ